jgi:hypothetical protein
MTTSSITEKTNVEFKEISEEPIRVQQITPYQIQQRFDLLRDLNEEQMNALNKRVVKRIDWRLMPCITLMFLMRSVFPAFSYRNYSPS